MRIKFRQEQTLVIKKTIVYDSVGVGLGQYRYDPIFITYIHDLNGSFISYSVYLSKDTQHNNEGVSRFQFKFRKIDWPFRNEFKIKLKQQFQGKETLYFIL